MPDSDAKDDPLRLSGSAKEDSLDVPRLRPRFMPRARSLAYGQCFKRPFGAAQGARALAERTRRSARRACAATPRHGAPIASARQRRLSLVCDGRTPGSPS
jgi:hypothetical protein